MSREDPKKDDTKDYSTVVRDNLKAMFLVTEDIDACLEDASSSNDTQWGPHTEEWHELLTEMLRSSPVERISLSRVREKLQSLNEN